MISNPLLYLAPLPKFSEIKPEHIEPGIEQLIANYREVVKNVVAIHANKIPTWDSFIKILELTEDELERAWSLVSHLNSVMNTKALHNAYDNCLPKLSKLGTEMGQNKNLYNLTKTLMHSPEFITLSVAQKKTLENNIREFQLSGIDLSHDKQKRYGEIQQRLSELSSRFEQNILDNTNSWSKLIVNTEDLVGLPDSALNMVKQAVDADNSVAMEYVLNLQSPCYLSVMMYADNRALREEMYRVYNTRASELCGNTEWDNTSIIEETLVLRHEIAQLLGFDSYAHKSLSTKMAKNPMEVVNFLSELGTKVKPAGEKEYSDLQAYAKQAGCDDLQAWDVLYYSEKLQQECYEINQETLKPYFSALKVIQGLFDIVSRLYGISIQQVEAVDVWHEDIQFFEIHDSNGVKCGAFYLDLYVRKNKRSGAWMDVCSSRFAKNDGLQTPIAYLICNFTPPMGERPVLFTHDEVITLFHEFGHGLHHMLTQVNYPSVSGISGVEWDAVEVPSQFMENWCWEREALDLFACHYKTNEPLPENLFQKMIIVKNFQSAMKMVRQIELSLFDFCLHLEFDENWDRSNQNNRLSRTQQFLDQVRLQVSIVIPPKFNRFQNCFSHIFAGNYAAGYYSYKWAEVLSADAFSKFEENGIFDRFTGEEFLHTVLERGGSQDFMELFVEFRGRKPSIAPLLRHCGLSI